VYNRFAGWTESGPTSGVGAVIQSMVFTPGTKYDLSQINLAMAYISGTDAFTLELVNDSSDHPGEHGTRIVDRKQSANCRKLLRP
jgi:hypothetical protein